MLLNHMLFDFRTSNATLEVANSCINSFLPVKTAAEFSFECKFSDTIVKPMNGNESTFIHLKIICNRYTFLLLSTLADQSNPSRQWQSFDLIQILTKGIIDEILHFFI